MTEPRIQYAKTSDGVSIAFWTLGEGGVPLVHTPLALSWGGHLELEWQVPPIKEWYEALARTRMLVRYDGRGTGLSDREEVRPNLEGWVMDLESVAERLALRSFALLGCYSWAMPAIAYAARYPERVSHLILWCGYAKWSDLGAGYQALTDLMDKDWELWMQTTTHAALGWTASGAENADKLMRVSAHPKWVQLALAALRETDVADLLPEVRSPTLVMHRRGLSLLDPSVPRRLASQIPNARLLLLEGTSVNPVEGDSRGIPAAIDEFLGEGEPTEPSATALEPSAFRTVLFTDLVGHTEMMSRLGDERGREVLREHERITREVLKAHGGTEVKTMGDGFMASFGSVTKAVECAIALQRAFAECEGEPLAVRVGLNAGEPIEEDGDLFGATVILASRIAAKAEGGEILVANAVREISSGKGFLFADRGDFAAKGFEEPVRLYEVRWRDY